jgi:hypothetical protein
MKVYYALDPELKQLVNDAFSAYGPGCEPLGAEQEAGGGATGEEQRLNQADSATVYANAMQARPCRIDGCGV